MKFLTTCSINVYKISNHYEVVMFGISYVLQEG